MKLCARCKQTKPVDDFPIDPRRPDARYSYCRQCKREYMKEHRQRDPEASREKQRRDNIKRYGVTVEQFDAMLATQGGRCAICGTTEPRRNHGRMAIDHDHATGRVRALLCGDCNNGLGLFGDDADRLRKAATYLEQHSTRGE